MVLFFRLLGFYSVAKASDCDENTLVQGLSKLRLQAHEITMNHAGPQLLESMEHLAEKVNTMHQDGIDDATLQSIDDAIAAAGAVIDQSLPMLVTEHQESQNQLDIARDAALGCMSSAAHGEAVAESLQNDVTAKRASHVTCGETEVQLLETRTQACDELSLLMTQTPAASCAMPNRDNRDAFGDMLDEMNSYVETWRQQFITKRDACETAENNYDAHSCNTAQSDFEVSYCSHRSGCSVLDSCWTSHKGELDALIESERTSMNLRQDQHRSLTQSQCIISLIRQAISANAMIDNDALTQCAEGISVEALTLTFHNPEGPTGAGCVAAASAPAACTAAFFNAEYGSPGFTTWQRTEMEPRCIHCPGSTPEELLAAFAWQPIGTLAQLEASVADYPFTEWTYGVRYNTVDGWDDVHDVVINSWNHGIRVSVTPFYPQGDTAQSLTFGTTVFTRDTLGQTPGEWIQRYYNYDWSNGNTNHVLAFRRRLPNAWQQAGTLAQLESTISEYPLTEWTYGVQYNHGWGDIHDIVINSWNQGIRVSVTPFYPQGDDAQSLAFGTTVFTRDTVGQTPGEWIQNYYQENAPVGSNGNANHVQVFRRRLASAWQAAGTLGQLESTVADYPFSEWAYGVQYNHGWGDVHDIVANTWNRGIRVSATPFYPQGDDAQSLAFGTTVFSRDTDGQTPGEWIQNYYQENVPVGSNGNADHVLVFRRRLPSAWQETGTLAQLESTVAEYPLTEWKYGVMYNSGWGDIHDVFLNKWNHGIRVSVTPSYPQGDNAQSLTFGTTVFTRNTVGQTTGEWIQNYFQGDTHSGSNGNVDHVRVFRQRMSSPL